jgi:hypothetical protein
MTKFIKEVERRAGVQFATVRLGGNGHYQAYLQGCGRPVVLPATPSARRALQYAVAAVKRQMKTAP